MPNWSTEPMNVASVCVATVCQWSVSVPIHEIWNVRVVPSLTTRMNGPGTISDVVIVARIVALKVVKLVYEKTPNAGDQLDERKNSKTMILPVPELRSAMPTDGPVTELLRKQRIVAFHGVAG